MLNNLFHKLVYLILLCSVNVSFATTYYVSNSGSDTNSGLSIEEAFATIQIGANSAMTGDTVLVLEGDYAGFDHRGASGTATQPIVFLAQGEVNIISSGPFRDDGINIEGPDYIVIDGFTVNDMVGNGNGIRIVLSDYILVQHNSCDNNAERGIFTGFTDDITIQYNKCSNSIDEHGIYVSNSSDRPVIRYNECFGNNNIGIHMNGDLSAGEDGIIHDAEVYGNILYDNNRAAGINMDGCLRAKVYNNLIYNNHSCQGIALFQIDGAIPSKEAEIYNNTIIVPSDGRWGILVKDGAHEGTKIYNNIIINNHSFRGCIATESVGQNFTSNFNIVNNKLSATGDTSTITLLEWQALGQGLHTTNTASLGDIFVNPSTSPPDYRLIANSQAIDSGTDLVSSVVSIGYDGVSRPQNNQYDIGAYERIYCPEKMTLTSVLPNAMYFAQDSIILNSSFVITSDLELNAPNVYSTNSISISNGASMKVSLSGCKN